MSNVLIKNLDDESGLSIDTIDPATEIVTTQTVVPPGEDLTIEVSAISELRIYREDTGIEEEEEDEEEEEEE